ncbi:MAG: hypothetical protein E7267_07305 [Lachnospiraceae bacterium]|nr:hypothetical protein [Lachnospiraceae bacterium]
MSIYVIFTGGTIGSSNNDNVINTDSSIQEYFISIYKEKYLCEHNFKCMNPYTILSENLGAHHLRLLINAIKEVLSNKDVEGIIVNHGTDTLQYTSAILSYVFSAINIPILLVSSNYVLSDLRSNGLINFHFAIKFIEQFNFGGVFVSYKNENDIPYIHFGTRLSAPLLFSADISSVNDSWFARFEKDVLKYNDAYNYFTAQNHLFDFNDDINLYKLSDGEILWIRPYPEMSYTCPSDNTKAVLHESFHSGSIAVNDDMRRFANECCKKNIPIYITGLEKNEAVYDNVNEYKKLGFVPVYGYSPIALYCKIWLSICNDLDISEVVKKLVAFDMI